MLAGVCQLRDDSVFATEAGLRVYVVPQMNLIHGVPHNEFARRQSEGVHKAGALNTGGKAVLYRLHREGVALLLQYGS